MRENLIVSSPQAYGYPLVIRHLLTNSLSLYGDQEITYRGEFRYTYRVFRRRVGQLASALEGLGVRHGTTVAVMDWDSHRYLESYFAVPLMGAVLLTVNVRLAPEQIAYTLNHSGANLGGIAAVYNLHEYETERAEAMEAWSRYVMAVVDGKPPQNVVSLRPVA